MGIILSLLILCVIIFIHEGGHYLAMRRYGVDVKEFSIGMGPLLWSTRLANGTQFSIRCLPIGGYAMPVTPIEQLDLRPWPRFVIYVAGMFVNATAAFVGLVFHYSFSSDTTVYSLGSILLAAAVMSYGLWLATPVLVVKMVVENGIMSFFKEASGPIGIIDMGQRMTTQSPSVAFGILFFFCVINVGLAGINALPLYPFDGGRIAGLFLEKISGSHKEKVIKYYTLITTAMTLFLILTIIGSDIIKLIFKT